MVLEEIQVSSRYVALIKDIDRYIIVIKDIYGRVVTRVRTIGGETIVKSSVFGSNSMRVNSSKFSTYPGTI